MKKTLLIAAAALAAGVVSSQAQVYSQNVVGYANVPTPVAGAQYLLSIPFNIGASNGANEVFGPTLPEFSSLLIWNVGTASYSFAQVDSGSATGWSDQDYNEIPVPTLPVGQGFFLSPFGSNVTNTFAGTIAVNVGTSNKMSLPTGGAQYLVGCVVPYAGAVTNGNDSGGGPNLNALPEFSSVLVWNTSTASYSFSQVDSGSPSGWSDQDYNEVAPPTITVGQGFFISPFGSATWTTGL